LQVSSRLVEMGLYDKLIGVTPCDKQIEMPPYNKLIG
jgi:hypothetical protein